MDRQRQAIEDRPPASLVRCASRWRAQTAMSDTHRLRADCVVTPASVLHDAVIEIGGDRVVSCVSLRHINRVRTGARGGLGGARFRGCPRARREQVRLRDGGPSDGARRAGVPRRARHDFQSRQPGDGTARAALPPGRQFARANHKSTQSSGGNAELFLCLAQPESLQPRILISGALQRRRRRRPKTGLNGRRTSS